MASKLIAKGKGVRLAKGLTSKEFDCQCACLSCRATIISYELIKAYAKFRALVNVKLRINSGYRCPLHNQIVGGVPLSRHTSGEAIDISKTTLNHLCKSDIDHAAKISGFTKIIHYKTFVHLDVRKTKEKK